MTQLPELAEARVNLLEDAIRRASAKLVEARWSPTGDNWEESEEGQRFAKVHAAIVILREALEEAGR